MHCPLSGWEARDEGRRGLCVATQVIEAGVDISFQRVIRFTAHKERQWRNKRKGSLLFLRYHGQKARCMFRPLQTERLYQRATGAKTGFTYEDAQIVKEALRTLFVTSEDVWLSPDGENVVVNREKAEVARFPLHALQGIISFSCSGAHGSLCPAGCGFGVLLPAWKILGSYVRYQPW